MPLQVLMSSQLIGRSCWCRNCSYGRHEQQSSLALAYGERVEMNPLRFKEDNSNQNFFCTKFCYHYNGLHWAKGNKPHLNFWDLC